MLIGKRKRNEEKRGSMRKKKVSGGWARQRRCRFSLSLSLPRRLLFSLLPPRLPLRKQKKQQKRRLQKRIAAQT
jgi:hypothetical protein